MIFDSKISYTVILLPIPLMYVLIAVRMLDRRDSSRQGRYRLGSSVNIRDAALIAIALDVSELAGVLQDGLSQGNMLPISMIAVALSFHMLAYMGVSRIYFRLEGFLSRSATRSVMTLYVALTLLMTNAVTLMDIMQAMGKGL